MAFNVAPDPYLKNNCVNCCANSWRPPGPSSLGKCDQCKTRLQSRKNFDLRREVFDLRREVFDLRRGRDKSLEREKYRGRKEDLLHSGGRIVNREREMKKREDKSRGGSGSYGRQREHRSGQREKLESRGRQTEKVQHQSLSSDHHGSNFRGNTKLLGAKDKGHSSSRGRHSPQKSRKLEEKAARRSNSGSRVGKRNEDWEGRSIEPGWLSEQRRDVGGVGGRRREQEGGWRGEQEAKKKSCLKQDERIREAPTEVKNQDKEKTTGGETTRNLFQGQQIVLEERESVGKQKTLYEKYKKSVERCEHQLLKMKEQREALKRAGQKHEDFIMWENANLQRKLKYRIARMKGYMEEFDGKVQTEMKERAKLEKERMQREEERRGEEEKKEEKKKAGSFSSHSLASSGELY